MPCDLLSAHLVILHHALGNCAILKPSEISQATEKLLTELISKYLSKVMLSLICYFRHLMFEVSFFFFFFVKCVTFMGAYLPKFL